MNLHHIKYAQAVARCGSINKAAKELYITQPYLSYCLRELEHCYGITLFRRTPLGSVVTKEGKEFLEMAQSLLAKVELIESKYKQAQRSEFAIYSTRTVVALKAFEIFCQEVCADEPYEFSFFETGMIEVIEHVYYNTADIGIVLYFTEEANFVCDYVKDKNLKFRSLDSVPVYVTISKDHKLARNSRLNGHEMENYPCVTYSDFTDSVLNLEKECELIAVEKPQRLVYVRDRHTLLRMLSNTEAYAVGHKFTKEDNKLFNLVSIPVKDRGAEICFGYVTRRSISGDDYKKRYQDRLINILEATLHCFK